MVSEFQKELVTESLAKADFCHEIKEIVDAIIYLEDDINQANLAKITLNERGTPIPFDEYSNLSNIRVELNVAKEHAKSLLQLAGCPAYKSEY